MNWRGKNFQLTLIYEPPDPLFNKYIYIYIYIYILGILCWPDNCIYICIYIDNKIYANDRLTVEGSERIRCCHVNY